MKKRNNLKYKIAFVLDDGLDIEDGVQQYILTLGNWLKSNGHIVHYLVGETKRQDIPNLYSVPKNIKVTYNANKLTIPVYSSKTYIKKLLSTNNYDVIHVQVPYSPIFGAKVVSTYNSLCPDGLIVGTFHIAPYDFLTTHLSKLLRIPLYFNIKKFNGFISVSSAGQKFAKQIFNIESKIIPNTVDLSKFSPNAPLKPNKKLHLVYLGRLVKRKGCKELIDALHVMQQEYHEIEYQLTVCGRGSLKDELEALVKGYGLSDKVKFVGFVSEKQKIRHLQEADLAVFPSISGESFGIVLIEAMAAGSGVVLGGDNAGYRTVLSRQDNTLIDVKDSQSFASTLFKFMTDKNLRNEIHKNQQKSVLQYDTENVGPQILDFYDNCIKRKNNR